MDKLRQKILAFIYAPKDVPLLAGFVVGLYMLLYYYSKNFALANSWIQLGFFVAYYMVLPMVLLYTGYKILGAIKKGKWQRQFLFVAIPVIMAFYLLQLSWLAEYKRPIFAGVIVVAVVLSFKAAKYYKLFVVLIAFMALFNAPPLAKIAYMALITDDSWKKQPDDIEKVVFKHKPNIYYLQPDGYASFNNLAAPPYNFDNAEEIAFLKKQGFTLYNNYRSNYYSTLLSNSSMFSMKHHYIQYDIGSYAARGIIVGNNPVLQILKNNGYKTHFITEKSYLLMNRPQMGYDYCNISYAELPYVKDGWDTNEPIEIDFYKALKPGSGNFYFLEKLSPGHIMVYKNTSKGVEEERKGYLEMLAKANEWLNKTISFIIKKDPDGIIIVGADHGGFVGYEYTLQSEYKTDNPQLVKSVFGAMAAIKWNNPAYKEYDTGLKTSVNLFRTVFSFLAEDKKYLKYLQEDCSYINMAEPKGLYRTIDANGKVVLQKIK